jgi:hypothetical protein
MEHRIILWVLLQAQETREHVCAHNNFVPFNILKQNSYRGEKEQRGDFDSTHPETVRVSMKGSGPHTFSIVSSIFAVPRFLLDTYIICKMNVCYILQQWC